MIHNHEVESSSLSLATTQGSSQIKVSALNSGCSSARLEYTSGGRVVAGSNPVIPTNRKVLIFSRISRLFLFIPTLSEWAVDVTVDAKKSTKKSTKINENFCIVICYKYKVLANRESPLMLRISKDGRRSRALCRISIEMCAADKTSGCIFTGLYLFTIWTRSKKHKFP